MRVTKEYDERKNEILDAAENLFHIKGYEKCTINDIIKNVGIAKGTFYYYFKSKEEVLDSVVERYTNIAISRAKEVEEKDYIRLEEKLMNAFMAMQIKEKVSQDLFVQLHKSENALLHQKTLNLMVNSMAPFLAKIVEEGNQKEVWSCKYPLEYMEIFLVASLTLTDEAIFKMNSKSQMNILIVLVSILEKMLNVQEDSFTKLLIQNFGDI